MEQYRRKIKEVAAHTEVIKKLQTQGKRVVFTNGCFDLLHIGHARYLYDARQQGDYLIVAVNSDSSVKRLNKGDERPIVSEEQRMEMIAALEFVDAVALFDEDTPYEIVKELVPDVIVKGGDWKEDEIIGSDIVIAAGGKVKSLPFVDGFSTTDIVNKLKCS